MHKLNYKQTLGKKRLFKPIRSGQTARAKAKSARRATIQNRATERKRNKNLEKIK